MKAAVGSVILLQKVPACLARNAVCVDVPEDQVNS